MPLQFVCEDIPEFEADAIVYAATVEALTRGDAQPAPGTEKEEELEILSQLGDGELRIVYANDLYCTYVIHTLCPVWQGGDKGECDQLAKCWRDCLQLAADHDCRSVGFPLIGAGIFGFPPETAVKIAAEAVEEFSKTRDMEVSLVFDDEDTCRRCRSLCPDAAEG